MWSYGYLYHPFLEGATFIPSIYGAVLGAALGSMQSLMFSRVGARMIWILVSAASAAVGLELASWLAPLIGSADMESWSDRRLPALNGSRSAVE